MPRVSTKYFLIPYFLKMLDQQAEQDATNLAAETLINLLAAREKEQEKVAVDVAGRGQVQSQSRSACKQLLMKLIVLDLISGGLLPPLDNEDQPTSRSDSSSDLADSVVRHLA